MSNEHLQTIDRKRGINRRQFLKLSALIAATLTTAGIHRAEIRQWLKTILKSYPKLYSYFAYLEEYGLEFIGMPTQVDIAHRLPVAGVDARPASTDELQRVTNAARAVEVLQRHPILPYRRIRYGTHSLGFEIDDTYARQIWIQHILGLKVQNNRGEHMPKNFIALHIQLPAPIRTVIAPLVPIPGQLTPAELRMNYTMSDYQALKLPQKLYVTTLLSPGHRGLDIQPVPQAERMKLLNRLISGRDLENGNIAPGTLYLESAERGWRLLEWSANAQIEADSSLARLFWHLTPTNSWGQREYAGYPAPLHGEMLAHLNGYLNSTITGAPYEQIGPSLCFRTNLTSGESDIFLLAPFLGIVAPETLYDILINTPVGDASERTGPNDLLIGLGDTKYGAMNGLYRPILSAEIDPLVIPYDASSEPITQFQTQNNTIALYLGI